MSSAIGIEKKAVAITMGANEDAQVAEALSGVLADTFKLYLKTHNSTSTWLDQCPIHCT